MPRTAKGRTLASDVYGSIKGDILLGRLEPGQRLHLADLCATHEVSLSVVREAVTRLAAEHLVQARPQQGFHVRSLSEDDLRDLTRVRVEIESLAVAESVEVGDVSWEADLVAAHHRMLGAMRDPKVVHETPNYDWMEAHSAFHAALAAACTSPLLKDIRQQLSDAAELYRFWSASKAKRKRNLVKEHKALLDAALAHDVEASVKLISEHIRLTSDLLLAGRPAEAGTHTA